MLPTNQIIKGDCLEVLKAFPDQCVDCCVTSPPYWGQRDYGAAGQHGNEETPEEYIEMMVAVFDEVRRVLKDNGTLWLNLGDKYNNYNSSPRDPKRWPKQKDNTHRPRQGLVSSAKYKDLLGLPWRVALAIQADGWWLRRDIIWEKDNPMPESCKDRCTTSHEYIFHLSKSGNYYYDSEAIKEPHHPDGRKVTKCVAGDNSIQPRNGERWPGSGRNKRSVWHSPTACFKGAHFAVYPSKLIEPCILAGCPSGGVVLDPYAGTGTTAEASKKLNRDYVGIEINPESIEFSDRRLSQEVLEL